MRKVVFIALIVLYRILCIAETTYFDFSLNRYLIDENKEKVVNFKYELEGFDEGLFLVKPFISNGVVEVFNPEKNMWVSSFSLVSDLPTLQKEMLIKIKGFGIEKTCLYFEILNLSNGQVYITPKKEIWSKKVYEKYLENLNKKIKGDLVLKNEGEGAEEEILDSVFLKDLSRESVYKKVCDKITKDYFYLLVFFEFSIFFYAGSKKGKKGVKKIDFESRTYGVDGKIL